MSLLLHALAFVCLKYYVEATKTKAHVLGGHEVALREIAPGRLPATCVGAAGPVTIGLVAARPQK